MEVGAVFDHCHHGEGASGARLGGKALDLVKVGFERGHTGLIDRGGIGRADTFGAHFGGGKFAEGSLQGRFNRRVG
ncbi:MAG: hypothetical protein B7X53_18755 [Hyphomonas sp. 34-62-18]|nr:hypothetical protein [Hyphomonas sp. 34-62-18]OZB11410.1 MAG: hypothetical protein B7X53_18755 [Hyphomonas sp. 34-62-18]